MSRLDRPLESLSAAIASAVHRDLPDIAYRDRDWERFHLWKRTLSREVLVQLQDEERRTGVPMGPADLTIEKVRRPGRHEVAVCMFPQTWASTALGYGGVGGAAMTTAYTVVASRGEVACVYFGDTGRLAYRANARNEQFLIDLHAQLLKARSDAAIYGDPTEG